VKHFIGPDEFSVPHATIHDRPPHAAASRASQSGRATAAIAARRARPAGQVDRVAGTEPAFVAATAAPPSGAYTNPVQAKPERSTPVARHFMDTLPNSSDTSFQIFLAKLLEQPQPEWTEKQQMELEMARSLSTEMVRYAEDMRGRADLARCLVLLRYAKVLDFMLTSLAAHRDIHPQTLRTLFRLANLKVDDAYPV
jgi:hypothetical protein